MTTTSFTSSQTQDGSIGAIEGAKSAMRQALRLAPGHAAANANVALLRRVGADAQESDSAPWQIRRDFASDPRTAGDKTVLSAWRPNSAAASVGLAVEYLSRKPAFAELPFGEWSHVLFYQVARGHYFFVVDQGRRIRGFLGWALTDQRRAELWVEGRSGLSNSECLEGDCVIVNAWSADAPGVNAFIREAVRKLFADRRSIYFKRHYPDGRERPMRLSIPAHRTAPLAQMRDRLARGEMTTDERPLEPRRSLRAWQVPISLKGERV
jgi:hemolysin-activating ACP:hemolysin acyltransferase